MPRFRQFFEEGRILENSAIKNLLKEHDRNICFEREFSRDDFLRLKIYMYILHVHTLPPQMNSLCKVLEGVAIIGDKVAG